VHCLYPKSSFHPDADPDSDPSFQIRAQTREKVIKLAHIPFNLACYLQIDAEPDPDTAYKTLMWIWMGIRIFI
jgi:hypothetical protein